MALLQPFLPWIIMAVIVGGGWVWTDQRCNSACKREVASHTATKKTLALEVAARAAADRKADALDLAYAALQEQSQKKLKSTQEAHDARIAQLDVQIKNLRSRNASLSGDLLRVWQRASESANQAAGNGPASQGSDGPAAEIPGAPQAGSLVTINEGDLAVFVRDAAAAYGSCTIKLRSCVTTYNDARDAQLRSLDGP